MTFRPPGAPWEFTRRVIVRTTGFPVSWLLDLQSPALADGADECVRHEAALHRARGPLLGWLGAQRRTATTVDTVRLVRRVEHAVRRLRAVPTVGLPPSWLRRLGPWNDLVAGHEAVVAKLAGWWTPELDRVQSRLRELAATASVQEAVFLNSTAALADVRRFAAGRGSAKTRRMVLRYLQRFCAKVETAGFYGPVNYGDLSPEAAHHVSVRARGDGRTAERRVLLSYWTVQAIADRWAGDPHCVGLLRLYRAARSDANTPIGDLKALLAFADGRTCLADIAHRLEVPLEAVHADARRAEADGLVRIGLRVPATVGDPLGVLTELVAGTRWSGRRALLTRLERLETWRAAFERAGLAERERLLPIGEGLLAELSGTPQRRGAGGFYADRFCFTEEGVGNLTRLSIGRPFAEHLLGALTPALDLIASAAVTTRERQHHAVRELLGTAGTVSALRLVDADLPPAADRGAVDRWSALVRDAEHTVAVTPAGLRGAGLIRDDLDGWPLFCAPDVMIVAGGIEDIERDNWQVVLAETHHICPPTQLPFVTFEPAPAATRADVRAGIRRMAGSARPTLQAVDGRTKTRDYTPAGHAVLWLEWQAHEPGTDAIRVGDCVVDAAAGGRPVLRGGDGTPLALFPEYDEVEPAIGLLRAVSLPQLDKRPVQLAKVSPRVTIGRLIYQRRSWFLSAEDMPACDRPQCSVLEYVDVWRWKTRWGMPDQVFVRLATEAKPLLLDFRSPLSVDTFLRDVCGCDRIEVEEMLPAFDQLWLGIGAERYCTELRLTAFRTPPDAPGVDEGTTR